VAPVLDFTNRLYFFLAEFVTFFVFDATLFCLLFVNKLRRANTEWPRATMDLFGDRLHLQTRPVADWIGLNFVAMRTRCIGSLIYFPFVPMALLIVSYSTVFNLTSVSSVFPDEFTLFPRWIFPSEQGISLLLAQGTSLSVVFSCAIMLSYAAKAMRDTAKRNLMDGIILTKGDSSSAATQMGWNDNDHFTEPLENLLNRVDQLNEGAFRPLWQQPVVIAMLLPLGSFGWKVLLEAGLSRGL